MGHTPNGQNKVMLTERNNFGILDHYVKLTSGIEDTFLCES
jgi:hypothetical protein